MCVCELLLNQALCMHVNMCLYMYVLKKGTFNSTRVVLYIYNYIIIKIYGLYMCNSYVLNT